MRFPEQLNDEAVLLVTSAGTVPARVLISTQTNRNMGSRAKKSIHGGRLIAKSHYATSGKVLDQLRTNVSTS